MARPRSVTHVLARIGKPHGLRGEVTVQLHTDDPAARLATGATFPTQACPGSLAPSQLEIASVRVHNGIYLLSFVGFPDRSAAEALRGTQLLLDALPESADADAWYPEDLVGYRVLDTAGQQVGSVAGLELGPAQDRLVVDLADGGQALIPFVTALVPQVDDTARTVQIDPPPGLLELGRS